MGTRDFTFIREIRVPMDRDSPRTHRGLFGFSRSLMGLFGVFLWCLRGLSRGQSFVSSGSLWRQDLFGVFGGHF
jgi:hypothetical protein